MDIQILIAVAMIAIALIVIIRWRSGARYGKIRPSRDVTTAYECFSIDSNRNYYISGSETYPSAMRGSSLALFHAHCENNIVASIFRK